MRYSDFASYFFSDSKIKGAEVTPKHCPFCGGGSKRDKGTFSFNMETGGYNCRRDSCGAKGGFKALCEQLNTTPQEWGESALEAKYEPSQKVQKDYKKPNVSKLSKEIPGDVLFYLDGRGIKLDALKAMRVRTILGKDGENKIAFPYVEGSPHEGNVVLVKYRHARDELNEGESKAWQSGGGKPVLWHLNECDIRKPLVITEGEYDAIVVYQCGFRNVASVPFGAGNLDWIEACWDLLEQFPYIILWMDDDKAGQSKIDEIISRLGEDRIKLVHSACKDANELLLQHGEEAVKNAIEAAEFISSEDSVELSGYQDEYSPDNIFMIKTPIEELNNVIGGLGSGLLTILSGKNSSGKTAFLTNIVAHAVHQGCSVAWYHGESKPHQARYPLELNIAGCKYVEEYARRPGAPLAYHVKQSVIPHVRQWYKNKVHMYNNNQSHSLESVLTFFERQAKRYGSKLFIIDNLMSLSLGDGSRQKELAAQSDAVRSLTLLAQKYGAHIILVVHPRKMGEPGAWITKDDVKGTGDITNWADNVLLMHRLSKSEKENDEDFIGYDAVIEVAKNRVYGEEDIPIKLIFDRPTRKFFRVESERKFEYDFMPFDIESSDDVDFY